ncbi:disease resistance protein RPM1-like [Triticum dicoccoides]|uniref:disease resistance protein RPM1-like n=1 Tax=Triticum dicoccoides TaxID=85692 RepID=UPI00188FC6E0|nr:disease resistance protein RPM1-like [Triticum dicoccoides]
MSGTVVSMARSMLMGAISVAASAAAAEMSLLIGVRKDIWFIKDEPETMHAFLLSVEATKNKSMVLQVWAKQVRDLAYGIEDCLAEFMVHVGSQSWSQQLLKLKDRHRIASQIRDLKARVEEVSNRNTRYNLMSKDASSGTDEVNSYMEDIRSHSASNIDEAELVGFAKPKEELIKMVDVGSKNGLRKVICIVGMGGLGKTTLARKAYESKEDTINNFSCCAWVTVSQSFYKIEMLKDMIRQLLGGDSLKICLKELEGKEVQVDNLASYLREKLTDKRYFIVLDDLWTKDIVIPSRNNKGSRIIVTTRDDGLAKQCTSEALVYHLKYLQTGDATNLLLIKSRTSHQDMENDKEMKTMANKIVNKCGGLPLDLLTIGGMLATKKVTEWESIYKQIPLELEVNSSLEAMRRIVTLSYNHLPSHLKSCFLYLSIFPEDFEIKRRRLVERWIAEGFVRARAGVNIEDVGNNYFNELINRSMIQPSFVNVEGIVKSCRVHDIVRDVMVSISRDENFVYVPEDNVTSVSQDTFRQVAYHGSKFQNIGMDWGHVRSLTIFSERLLESLLCSPKARMLRALDLENSQFEVTQKDISNIGLLCHLKYVNLSNPQGCSYIYKIPRSIGQLQGLRTLNIRNSYITELPTEISKLKSLHSLRCTRNISCERFDLEGLEECLLQSLCLPMMFTPLVDPSERAELVADLHMTWSSRWSESYGVKVPKGIGKLKELQTLEVVDIGRTGCKTIKELGELVQLRKLSMVTEGATKRKCKVLCVSITKLTSLRSLEVDGSLKWLHVVSCPPPQLRTLKLGGCLGDIPGWFGNLMHLVKLYLWDSKLKEEGKNMEILGLLPSLMKLRLGLDSYIGEKLAFKTGAFANLKKLDTSVTAKLREMKFEDGTSPKLQIICIGECYLTSGVIGINHLPRLKEISLGNEAHVAKLAMLQSEVEAHPNSPLLRLYTERSIHDLGDNIIQVEEATGESSSLHPGTAAAGESS